ncbi:MAG: hypothetical protein QM784_22785 [Polyangiaceae bacterium]
MAWEAILAMLPPVLIRLLIEKLVAVIVPAAGALLAIVEGLQAAWGTISSIIAAIDKFITFLKAVKGGGAGAQFAAALASAAIVVLDFVANFLIAKLASGLKKLAGKLGGIAKRLMKRRKAAGGRSARKARRNKRKGERGPKRKRRGASKPRRRPGRPKRRPTRPRRDRSRIKGRGKDDGKLVHVPIPDGEFGEKLPFQLDEESHTLKSEKSGGGRVVVHSAPMSVSAFLSMLSKQKEHRNSKSRTEISTARAQAAAAIASAKRLAKLERKKVPKSKAAAHRSKIANADKALENHLRKLRATLSRITGYVHINTKRLWSGQGRPGGFRTSTQLELARRWPNLHVLDANGDPTTTLRPDIDRRHIKAFSIIRDDYQLSLHGKPFPDAVAFLKTKKQAPRPNNRSVENATRKALTDEFNDIDNLFPGAADVNRRLGHDMKAERDKKREALERGDKPAADKHAKGEAKHGVDTPERKEQSPKGKKRPLSVLGEGAIQRIRNADAQYQSLATSLKRSRSAAAKQQVEQRISLQLAFAAGSVKILARESLVVRTQDIERVRRALTTGVYIERAYRELLAQGPRIQLSDAPEDRNLL